MAFWMYMLQCSDGSFYTGHTDNLDLRIAQHQHGEGAEHTRMRRPVQLAYSQAFATRDEAMTAELQIKRWSRAKKKALAAGDWAALSAAARKCFVSQK
ncbi:GIY-YIG nuclease family protein [Hydrocarboniphaga sp.]|uniref:GIY-YIG nuclease family protein n=1 Tax=Hydrocarboniphaga sp. TaxID=2033016 RepID=UPI003D128B1B